MIAITNKQLLALKDKIDTLDIRAIVRTDDEFKLAKVTRLLHTTEKSFVTEFDNDSTSRRHEYIAKHPQTEGSIIECMYFIVTGYNQHIDDYVILTRPSCLMDLNTGKVLEP